MAKKEPNIADLIKMMESHKTTENVSIRKEKDANHQDAVMIKGSMDELNSGFQSVFAGKVDKIASEETPFQTVGLLDQIRLGVDGMKLTMLQRARRWVKDFAGFMPGRAARETARKADLATALVRIDTRAIAQSSMDMLDTMRDSAGQSKIGLERAAAQRKALFASKGPMGKAFSLIGSGIGFLTGRGGKDKEKQNEERRHKSKHITLLEAILKALGGQAEEDDEGGGGKSKWGRWAMAAKRLATIAGIILGIALAPFVFLGTFFGQLGKEVAVISKWVAKTAKWGKGTFYDPVKNAVARLFKIGDWADDFKKGFNTKWQAFKARFSSSTIMQIFSRLRMRLNSIRINMLDGIKNAMKAFRNTKVISGLMGTIGRFGTRLTEIKTTFNSSLGRAVRAFNKSKVISNVTGVFSTMRASYSNAASRLTRAIEGAAQPRGPGGRFARRATNPFSALRSRFGVEQAKIVKRVGDWGTAFGKSRIVTKLGGMFNALKLPFIAVQEFLMGKKAARPPGMPPMLAAAPKGGGIMKVITGIGSFFRTVGGSIMKIPGVSLILKPAMFLGRMFGKLFLPLTLLFGIFDGVSQWKTNEGFAEGEEPDTILKKIRASISRAVANAIGMLVDVIMWVPKKAVTWMLEAMGFGSTIVETGPGGMGAGKKVDSPWMKKLKEFSFATLLFDLIWTIGSIPGQAFDFIVEMIKDPLGTLKDIINPQWVKDHIWDSGGGEGQPKRLFGIPLVMPSIPDISWPVWGQMFKDYIFDGGADATKSTAAQPMRIFGIPLVMPNLPSIKWPEWGKLFKEYIYDGDPEDGDIKIFGMTLKWPSLPTMPDLSDMIPDWLKNPGQWFEGMIETMTGWMPDWVKKKMGIATTKATAAAGTDKPGGPDARLTGIRESIESLQREKTRLAIQEKRFLAESAFMLDRKRAGGWINPSTGKKGTNAEYFAWKKEQQRTQELSLQAQEKTRMQELGMSISAGVPAAPAGGGGGGNLAVDNRQTTNVAVSQGVAARTFDTSTLIMYQGPFANRF